MKKKLIATLALLLTINCNVYAADINTTEGTITESIINRIEYSTLDDAILSKNNTIKINKNIIDKLNINLNNLDEQEDDIEKNISSYRSQLASANTELASLQEKLQNMSGEGEETNSEAVEALGSAIKAVKTNIAMLEASIKGMVSQLDAMENQQTNVSMAIEKNKVYIEMINNQIIVGGENLLFSYDDIELSERKIDKNIALMQKRLDALNIQKKLGLITEPDIKSIELQIESLNSSKRTINNSKEKIRRQLNLMIGQSYDTPLTVVANPLLEGINVNSIDREKDIETAMDSNYNIKVQEYEVEAKKFALESADTSYENDSAEEDLDDAQLKLEDVKRSEKLKFQEAYEKVKDSDEALSLAKKNFAQAETKLKTVKAKYEVGLASKLEYDSEQIAYDIQVIEVKIAEKNLFNAYRSYQWMLKGLSV